MHFQTVEECKVFKKVSKLDRGKYHLSSPVVNKILVSKKDNYKKIFVRMIIRALYQKPELFGLDSKITNRNVIFTIFKELNIKLNLNYISQQKNTSIIPYSIPKT